MTEYEKVKSLLDELKIPYEEKDADYWKNSVTIPDKEDIIKELNETGAKGLEVTLTLGFGFCNILFTRNTERFIAVETD